MSKDTLTVDQRGDDGKSMAVKLDGTPFKWVSKGLEKGDLSEINGRELGVTMIVSLFILWCTQLLFGIGRIRRDKRIV